jgi:hypothetical protein
MDRPLVQLLFFKLICLNWPYTPIEALEASLRLIDARSVSNWLEMPLYLRKKCLMAKQLLTNQQAACFMFSQNLFSFFLFLFEGDLLAFCI